MIYIYNFILFNYINILKKNIITIYIYNFFYFFIYRYFYKNFLTNIGFFKINFYNRRYFLYSGKIFRLKMYKKKIKFIINRSHRVLLYFKNKIKLKKISKKKYKIFFFYNNDMYTLKNLFNIIRGLNIYTWRGIKYSHQFYNKKKGKISAYRVVM